MSEHNGSRGVNPAEIENLDEWELAICYKCGGYGWNRNYCYW